MPKENCQRKTLKKEINIMKNNILFTGIMPALFTPLNDDSTVNVKAVAPMMKWQMEQGVDGFYVLGGTGEGGVLEEKQRMIMAEAAADAVKGTDKKLILHIGAADTRSAQRLAKHAAEVGADAVSSVYPSFFSRYTVAEAKEYYRSLVEASGLPMLCYCNPMIQGNDAVQFAKTMMTVEGVIGLKYTMPNYYHMHLIKQINGGNINVINGPDECLICGLSMGADGGIGTTYNMMPGWFVELYKAFRANDIAKAQEMQFKINKVITVLINNGTLPASKLAMEALGFEPGHAAFPAHRYTQEERAKIIAELKEAGLLA